MTARTRILTGHRPTGPRHIGHLVGTLQTWAALQDTRESFFLVADLHVLTTSETAARIRENTIEMVLDWLAAGIDPARATLILQSAIPEHAVLGLLLGMLTPVSRLERVPTYKEQIQALGLNPSLGLLTYPVLQTADILLYRAEAVPVGEDQLPHLELAREVARRFNTTYGTLFPEPQPVLSRMPRLPGTDNRTMHTSYGNTIYLRDTAAETERKVMQMYTDPSRIHATDPGHVDGNPVFTYLDLFHPEAALVADLKMRYAAGKVGDVEVKRILAVALNHYLAPLRERRVELAARRYEVLDILYSGTERARPIARATLEDVYAAIGLTDSRALNSAAHPAAAQGLFC